MDTIQNIYVWSQPPVQLEIEWSDWWQPPVQLDAAYIEAWIYMAVLNGICSLTSRMSHIFFFFLFMGEV